LSGLSTQSTRGTRRLRSSRIAASSAASSVFCGLRETPEFHERGAPRVTAAAEPDTAIRIIPPVTPFPHESQQLPLAHYRVFKGETRELGLLGRILEAALTNQPFVDVVVVLEFERTERVRDVLDRVREGMREVIQRIQAPRVPLAIMMRVPNPAGSGHA
jgi:hypothetical protein